MKIAFVILGGIVVWLVGSLFCDLFFDYICKIK
jgi:hypothetical protein